MPFPLSGACAVLSSLQKEKTQLTQEALALYAIEVLLPPIIRAAAKRREMLVLKSEQRTASLPEALANVVGEEAVQDEALGPLPEDPHEPVLRQLKRALNQHKEGLRELQAWISRHPPTDTKAPKKAGEETANPMSLLGALGSLGSPTADASETSAPSEDVSTAGLTDTEKNSHQLLKAAAAWHAFASDHRLLSATVPHKRSPEGLADGQQLQAKGKSHAAAAILSALSGMPGGKPIDAFVKAFSR